MVATIDFVAMSVVAAPPLAAELSWRRQLKASIRELSAIVCSGVDAGAGMPSSPRARRDATRGRREGSERVNGGSGAFGELGEAEGSAGKANGGHGAVGE